jgi:hypothetical protein
VIGERVLAHGDVAVPDLGDERVVVQAPDA